MFMKEKVIKYYFQWQIMLFNFNGPNSNTVLDRKVKYYVDKVAKVDKMD